ncbi:MAG: hypothetical protein IT323_09405 [Anaerolineae bacterium]|nr:hypothetical protein [Anaerolineae bacterium]
MRDVIMTYWPSIAATRRWIADAETGEVKPVWGLVGVRLRTPEDDLGEAATPTDPVDPEPESAPEPHEPHPDGVCDVDPVDLQKVSEESEDGVQPDERVEEVFLPDDRITGSKRYSEGNPVSLGSDVGRSPTSLDVSEGLSVLSEHAYASEQGGLGCT